MKLEFETFRDLNNSYLIDQLKQKHPSNVNFLSYRKYKVTIELVEEENNVLIDRLEKVLNESIGYNKKERVKNAIKQLKL